MHRSNVPYYLRTLRYTERLLTTTYKLTKLIILSYFWFLLSFFLFYYCFLNRCLSFFFLRTVIVYSFHCGHARQAWTDHSAALTAASVARYGHVPFGTVFLYEKSLRFFFRNHFTFIIIFIIIIITVRNHLRFFEGIPYPPLYFLIFYIHFTNK